MPETTALLFGSYVLDANEGLFREQKLVPLPPKELNLLQLLAQKRGQVVSHIEIEERVWPRQLVSYESVSRCVYSLRKLLNVDGIDYIDTVHKRGYRMGVAVKEFEPLQSKTALSQAIATIPLAYSHYAAGMREANDPRPAAQERAILLFEDAAKADPDFAAAYAAVAETRMYQIIRGDLTPAEGLKFGLLASQRALDASPQSVQGMSIMGWFKGAMLGKFDEAHMFLEAALAIDPAYSRGYVYQSWVFRRQGLIEESLVAAQRGMATDPHALLNRHSYSWMLFCSGNAAEALKLEQDLQSEYPLDEIAHAFAGIFAAYLGKSRKALAASEAALELSPERPGVWASVAYILARTGHTERARQLADSAGEAILPRATKPLLAPAYTEMGDVDRALELLCKARDEGCVWFAPARMDPRLAALKMDDRFLALYS